VTVAATGKVTGGLGGIAGSSSGGGGGGVGIFSSANVTVDAGGTVAGGGGGRPASGGGGGGGAAAILLTGGGTLNNSGSLTGGGGGMATNSTTLALVGGGGSGGEGVLLTNGGSIINNAGASIAGGAGGANGPKFSIYGATSRGGAAIKGANVSIVNAGSISGGLDGSLTYNVPGTTRANAITFTGGVNSLELRAGSTIVGNVVAFSAADRFILGGGNDASFDASAIGNAAQYRGFGSFEKDWCQHLDSDRRHLGADAMDADCGHLVGFPGWQPRRRGRRTRLQWRHLADNRQFLDQSRHGARRHGNHRHGGGYHTDGVRHCQRRQWPNQNWWRHAGADRRQQLFG
jgi:hypothetical protein